MGRPSSPSPHQAIVLAFVLAGLVPHAAAQTAPPRPTFDQQQLPALYFNVWPADFNEDGVSDLVAGTRVLGERGDVVVAIGRGNGTFLDPVTVAFRAVPLVPADFNADGFIDLVILGDVTLEVLPGNGDATFDTAILIDENHQVPELRVWAHAADMNGDGRRDLIVPDRRDDGFVLLLYPGTGALTFEAPIVLPTLNDLPGVEITSGDFNGDGRRDFAVVDLCCTTVFINQGGYTFTPATVGGAFNDIVTNDLNGDGRLDLVVVAGNYWRFDPNTRLGEVSILFGNGNGTFQPPVRYPLNVHGTMSVVVGDFNGDSRLDVAAGSRSGVFIPDLGRVLSDSVSVLPGDGTGRLLAPVTYALAYIRQGDFGVGFTDSPYWTAHHQLNTSDLDGDRRTDLIASPGVTLLNRAPRSNRPPTAFAGPDRGSFQAEQRVFLGAEASDPDMDWLTYVWTDGSGRVISNWPATGAVLLGGATETYTLTVSDGRGGTASDTVTMRNQNPQSDPWLGFERPVPGENIQSGVPYILQFGVFRVELLTSLEVSYSLDDGRTFTTVPGCGGLPPTATSCTWSNPGPLTDNLRLRLTAVGPATGTWVLVSGRHAITALPPLPGGWSSTDIGAVGAAGTASFANGTWTIEGSGADIWANADELRYAYLAAGFVGAKDFTFTARVVGIENLHRWVKAGIMVREDLSPGARHVSLFATPSTERGLAFQRRLTPGGTSIHTAGPAIAPPMWLRVGRAGDVVSAYYRLSPTEPWILIGRETLPNLRASVYVGLAVSSHVDGALATATFDNVAIERIRPIDRTEDVGAVGLPGSTSFDGVVYELRGGGADIWGTADAFRFAYSYGTGSAPGSIQSIAVRVRSVQNTHRWAKAGVMFREFGGSLPSTAPDARHVMVVVTPGMGVAMQFRAAAGAPSQQVAVLADTAPSFVSLTRNSNTFTGWVSEDGLTWTQLGEVTLPGMFALPGLVVTSHNNATTAVATFDDLRLVPF